MSTEVKLPELGENIESATVVKILVSPGDDVDKDDPIIEVETDKATAEVPSTSAGTVSDVQVEKGDSLSVGDVILILDGEAGEPEKDEGEEKEETEEEKEDREAAEKTDEDSKRESKREKKRKDKKKETDEAEPEDREAGEDREAEKDEQDKNKEKTAERPERQGKREEGGGRDAAVAEAERASGLPESDEGDRPVLAAPSARRFADEIGVNIEEVHGSGPGGRITIRDVKRHARGDGMKEKKAAPREEETKTTREPLSPVRARTAEHMAWCWSIIPHVTLFARADITGMDELLAQRRDDIAEAGGKLSITSVVVKAAAAALAAFPNVNASFDEDSSELILKHEINIGVAVDTPQGLVVPVIRNAADKSISSIAVELTGLAERARNGDLSPGELRGGTFSVTNLGGVGTESFTPIVNHPEVAVLAVGRATMEPRYNDDEQRFEPRRMLPLALSVDHRAMDGADGARFLEWIVNALAHPLMIAMES